MATPPNTRVSEAVGSPQAPPRAYDAEDCPVAAAVHHGVMADVRSARSLGTVTVALLAGFFVVALLAGPGIHFGRTVWADSLAILALLATAATAVACLVAVEHWADRSESRWALPALWLYRLLFVAALAGALAIAFGWLGRWPGWGYTRVLTGGLTLAGAGMVAGTYLMRIPRGTRGEPAAASAAREDEPEPTRGTRPRRLPRKLVAIGASGGGIRAAAFALGGYQAVQDASEELELTGPEDEPHMFAVSGGSYVAAALAMHRTFEVKEPDATGHRGVERRETPIDWRRSYRPESPELERLRRHTRYLFEPGRVALDGAVTLLVGAVVNLFLLGAVLLIAVWLASQLAVTLGVVTFPDGAALPRVQSGWGLLAVPAICGGVLALLTVGSWVASYLFNAGAGEQLAGAGRDEKAACEGRLPWQNRWAERLFSACQAWRPAAAALAIGWVAMVGGIPAAATGVAELALENKPTATLARGLAALNLATPQMCRDAFTADLAAAAQEAATAARQSPGAARSATAGACGAELEVTRTVEDPAAPATAPAAPTGAELDALERQAGLSGEGLGARITGVGGLLLVVIGMLSRVMVPAKLASARPRLTALRRKVLTWVPMTATVLVFVYLGLLWHRTYLTATETWPLEAAVVVSVAAFVVGFLINANLTTLHSYYRSRLADAFSVGVDAQGRAQQLPYERVYGFSALARGPRLHVVATLNSQAANESPTMRAGFPLVLGGERVEVFREAGRHIEQPTRTYEAFAGPGRTSIMASVGISGAAVSPLMGRYAEQMAPYRFLLALFNIRLGTWVRNPAHAEPRQHRRGGGWRWLWAIHRPGLVQMALEAAGRSSADRRWVYLSDGGHLDNTGLVECVRHCLREQGGVGRVLVMDASNDPIDSWQAVGDAIAVVRADLNVDLKRHLAPGMPPWMRQYKHGELDVVVVKAVPVARPEPDQVGRRGDWWSVLPSDVQAFRIRHPDFPRASTTRQKFGDLEFEAYRALGYVAASTSLRAAGWLLPARGDLQPPRQKYVIVPADGDGSAPPLDGNGTRRRQRRRARDALRRPTSGSPSPETPNSSTPG